MSHNLTQGSEGDGFLFPFLACSESRAYPFIDNIAGFYEVALSYDKLNVEECLLASKIVDYSSYIGLMANPPDTFPILIYDQMFFADNHRGITLRYAHEIDDNTCELTNSYFADFSRSIDPSIYSSNRISYCNVGYAKNVCYNKLWILSH